MPMNDSSQGIWRVPGLAEIITKLSGLRREMLNMENRVARKTAILGAAYLR